MKLTESFRTVLTIKADENGNLPTRIQILPVGIWDSPTHGMFSLTPSDLQEFIDNFDSGKYRAGDSLPIDLGHGNTATGDEAAAWITKLELVLTPQSLAEAKLLAPTDDDDDPYDLDDQYTRDSGVWASVEWTPLGAEKVKNKQYKYFSPEFCPVYMDGNNGDMAANVLIGGGLVNRPFFRNMTPVVAHESGTVHNGDKFEGTPYMLFIDKSKDETMSKKASDTPEAAASNQNAQDTELKNQQDQATGTVESDPNTNTDVEDTVTGNHQGNPEEPFTQPDNGGAPGVGVQADEEGAEDKEDESTEGETETEEDGEIPTEIPTDEPTKVEGKEGTITITAAEKAAMDQKIEAGEKAIEALRTVKASETVKGWTFGEHNDGKFPPAVTPLLVEFYMGLNNTQAKKFEELVKKLPNVKMFAEVGQGEGRAESAVDVLEKLTNAKIAEKVKAGETLSYSEAWKLVISENADVATRYEEEREVKISES